MLHYYYYYFSFQVCDFTNLTKYYYATLMNWFSFIAWIITVLSSFLCSRNIFKGVSPTSQWEQHTGFKIPAQTVFFGVGWRVNLYCALNTCFFNSLCFFCSVNQGHVEQDLHTNELQISSATSRDFPRLFLYPWVLSKNRVTGWDGGCTPGSTFQSFCIMWKSACAAPLLLFCTADSRENKQEFNFLVF